MAGYLQERKAVTVPSLSGMRSRNEKIAMLTCYDAGFATLMDSVGIDILLIGDSLGMVCQGRDSTLPVTLSDIAYHTSCVARGNKNALIMTDMPFGACATPEATFNNAVQLIQAGAQIVKIEGGAWLADTVRFLTDRAIPVCAHIGLTPQFVNEFGGYRVQGKTPEAAKRIKEDALILEKAGAAVLLLEAVPSDLAKEITESAKIPTIGIGAGADCSGQVLVLHDMLNVNLGRKPRFVKNFMEGQSSIADAVKAYVTEVKQGTFPAPEHCY